MDYFKYNEGLDLLPAGSFKISPSRLSKFFDETNGWYRECVLNEAAMFSGNTASVLGTCVHGLAAMHTKEGVFDEAAVERHLSTITDPTIDVNYVRTQYPVMAHTLIDTFTSKVRGEAEPFIFHEIMPGFVVAGSVDLLLPNEIVDYKTTSAFSAPTSVSRNYWFQQMAYVWIMKQKGVNIKRFSLKYITNHVTGRVSEKTGKPLQDYPCTISTVTHEVTGDDLVTIEGVLRLVAESVKCFQEKPELRHLLAQDGRLKVDAPRKMFG